jgi:SAM-dependent methyltransferase
MVQQPYLDPGLARVYHQGNEMPHRSLRAWTAFIGSHSPLAGPAVLDVGTGTGMFALALACWRNASLVAGIDQSPAMLAQAAQRSAHERVAFLAGAASRLPVADHAFDLALLSRVIHHLPDRRDAAAELKRALRPAGVVVVRTTVRERLDAIVYDYWPQLRSLDALRFPSQGEIMADFAAAGLRPTGAASFSQPVQPSLRAWRESLALRAQSKFGQISHRDFEAGLRRLDDAVAAETSVTVVSERYDVLTFAA